MDYARFGTRFSAAVVDGVILYIIGAVIGFVIGLLLGGILGEAMQAVAAVVGIVVNWLYYAFQESSPKQATIGKQAFGIVVTDMDGKRISFARATGRYFGKILSTISLLIGYIMAAFTEKKQALHDMLAGTLVVKK